MKTKHILTLTILLFNALSCLGQQAIKITPASWDFGTINEIDGKVSHTFSIENISQKPIVVTNIVTSCGCTVPKFSKKPILAGESTSVEVTYDPTDRPGSFLKKLTIYSVREKLGEFAISGNVRMRERSTEEIYPIEMSSALRLAKNWMSFSYIYIGTMAQSSIGYANTSDSPITLEVGKFSSKSGYLEIDLPKTIAPKSRGEINVRYLVEDPHYGDIKDNLELKINGKKGYYPLMISATAIDYPTLKGKSNAPISKTSTNILKFGDMDKRATTQKRQFTLANSGSTPMIVRHIEIPEGVTLSLKAGDTITHDTPNVVEVEIDPIILEYGIYTKFIKIITNDPYRPERRIRVTANIGEFTK